MIRTSKRKNAGSRRNKHFARSGGRDAVGMRSSDISDRSTLSLTRDNGRHTFNCPTSWYPNGLCNCNPMLHRHKPNHLARAVPITDAFPEVA